MIIFRREFRRGLKSLIIWCLIMAGLILLTMSVYSQMAEQQEELQKLLDMYPESFKKAFGINELDFGSLIGFYGAEAYFMITLFGSVFAVLLAAPILVKEENDKTAEFLLSKPVTRTRIVSEKLAAVAVNLILFNAAVVMASVAGFRFAPEAEWDAGIFGTLMAGALLLQTTFAAVAFLLSAILRKSRNIVAASLGLVFVSYFIGVISSLSERLEYLKYVSFFEYMDAADIIKQGSIDPLYVFILTAVTAVSVGAAYTRYRRKDIAA